MTKYLALDASLTNCGYSIWQDDTYLLSGQFKPQGKDWIDKIQSVAKWLYTLSMRHTFDIVFYEKPTGTSGGKFGNKDTDRKLGALWYAVNLFCRLHNIKYIDVYSSQIKAIGLLKVFDDKKLKVDLEGFEKALHYKPFTLYFHNNGDFNIAAMNRQNDEIDAIGCGLAGMEKIKNE